MIRRLATLALLAAPALAQDAAREATEPAPAPSPLSCIAIVGASLSAGAGTATELELSKDAKLSVFLNAALAKEGVETHDFGNMWFFSDPKEKGPKQIADALAKEPTLVIAVDFLFWFAFGDESRSDRRRAEGLAVGLSLLDGIEVPLVIGDLPRIDHALEGKGPFGGPLVHRSMFPTEAERAEMNRTIHAWAAAREHVELMPLDRLVQAMVDGEKMTLRGNTWQPKSVSEALQADLLHPNVRGSVWSALNVADTLTRFDGVSEDDFRWDEALVAKRVHELTAERRAETAVRRAKAEARRRAREERKAKKEKQGGGV